MEKPNQVNKEQEPTKEQKELFTKYRGNLIALMIGERGGETPVNEEEKQRLIERYGKDFIDRCREIRDLRNGLLHSDDLDLRVWKLVNLFGVEAAEKEENAAIEESLRILKEKLDKGEINPVFYEHKTQRLRQIQDRLTQGQGQGQGYGGILDLLYGKSPKTEEEPTTFETPEGKQPKPKEEGEEGLIEKIIRFLSGKKEEVKKQKELAKKLGVEGEIPSQVEKERSEAQEGVIRTNIEEQSEKIKKEVKELSPEKQKLYDKIKKLAGNKNVQLALVGAALLGGSAFVLFAPVLVGMPLSNFLLGHALLVGSGPAIAGTAAHAAAFGVGGGLLGVFAEKLWGKKSKETTGKEEGIKESDRATEEAPEGAPFQSQKRKASETAQQGQQRQQEEMPKEPEKPTETKEAEEKPIRTNADILEDFSDEDKERIQDALAKAIIQGAEVEDYDWEERLEKQKQKEISTEERIIEDAKNKAGRMEQDRSKFFTGEDDLDAPSVPEFLKQKEEPKEPKKEKGK